MATVLVVGSGGREHAIAEAFARSPAVERVIVAPGNGGWHDTADVAVDDVDGLLAIGADLTFVGPEAPLAAGIVDRFRAEGRAIFGPTAAAARIEASKAFAKDFMERHGIPTAKSARFDDLDEAEAWLEANWGPLVLKASGLAAGKGVLLPDGLPEARIGLRELMSGRFGDAGSTVVIEERLEGPEVSLLAFCDGKTAAPMPAARDHKRIFEGDRGPNTGGMGAVAPVEVDGFEALVRDVLQAAVDGMAADGEPYVGVLFAGLMLTPDGPRVLEYNCRFGDPETQVLLPLLESDLYEVVTACLEGRLEAVHFRDAHAATVVLASEGYPGTYPKGRAITGLERVQDATVFHAGTRRAERGWVTSGGRVLAVTGVGESRREALARAYAGADTIHFEGRQLRRDIGASS